MALTSAQLADKAGVSKSTISWFVKRVGVSPVSKNGRSYLYDESAVEQILTFRKEHGRLKEKVIAPPGLYTRPQLVEKTGLTYPTITYIIRALLISPVSKNGNHTFYDETALEKILEYSKRKKVRGPQINVMSEKWIVEQAAKKEKRDYAAMYTLVASDNQTCERCGGVAERILGLGKKQLTLCEKCRKAFVHVASLGRLILGDEAECSTN